MILFVTRNVPDPNGTGSDQRAWYLLRALQHVGPVHLVVLYRPDDLGIEASSDNAAKTIAQEVRKIRIKEWASPHYRWPNLSHKPVTIAGILMRYCSDAPRLSVAALNRVGAQLPSDRYEIVFTEKLAAASIVNDLINAGLLSANIRIADFDDVASDFKENWLTAQRTSIGHLRTYHSRIELERIKSIEAQVAGTWDVVAVCKQEDVALLRRLYPMSHPVQFSNVIERSRLAKKIRPDSKLLFVGLLSYDPNRVAIQDFIQFVWPDIQQRRPAATLDIVGRYASGYLRDLVKKTPGVKLHEDVPTVEPFYEQADVVIIPVKLGSGTRIKAIEAMAYGRPMVSTSLGVEGLGVVNERHALIRDDFQDFAQATIRLLDDPVLSTTLADTAHELQRTLFGQHGLDRAVYTAINSALVQSNRAVGHRRLI